jgi:hypothetical protein
MYTLQEAIDRRDLALLDRQQHQQLLQTVDTVDELANSVTCSDVPAGFIGEDEAHEPLALIRNYEADLLSGTKADRVQALRMIQEDLGAWALERVRSTEYAMQEWAKIEKLARGMQS